MKMTEYMGSSFLKYQDLVAGPRQDQIADVRMGEFDRPVVEFESGDVLSLNKTNVRTLVRAYGKDSRDWVGMIVELRAGQTTYQGQTKDSVLVLPVSPPKPPETRVPTEHSRPCDEPNDEVPF